MPMLSRTRLRHCCRGFALAFASIALLIAPAGEAATPAAAYSPPPADAAHESPEHLISRLGLQQSPTPVRERHGWRAPRKILLLDFEPGTAARRAELASAAPGAQLMLAHNVGQALAAVGDADVLIGFNPQICDPRIIAAAHQLRWILSLAAGVENCMAVPAVHERNLLLTNMRGVDSAVIAEHGIALALALAHGLEVFSVDTEHAEWSRQHAARTPMQMLEGKTLLVVGLGGIGTEVARRGYGLGMKVIATRPGGGSKPEFVSYVGQPAELLTLARSADVIVSAVPLTRETTGLYDARFFAVLKPTALFINVARGASVVTDALVKALDEGRLAGAGLDVVDPEPLPPAHPLWRAPHVLITPHTSSRSDLPGEARWIIARENLRRYAAGEPMLSVVDLQRGY